jgi:hypothetical protein
MIWEGGRDYDDDRAPGLAAELLCLALLLFNVVAWGGLIWLVLQ